MNFQQKMVVAVMDIAMIVELCVAMYIANHHPESFTATFCAYFFSMLIPTLIVARIMVKRLRTPLPEPAA